MQQQVPAQKLIECLEAVVDEKADGVGTVPDVSLILQETFRIIPAAAMLLLEELPFDYVNALHNSLLRDQQTQEAYQGLGLSNYHIGLIHFLDQNSYTPKEQRRIIYLLDQASNKIKSASSQSSLH